MADGKVVIETDLDASGIKAGLSKLSGIAQSGIKGTLTAIASAGTALAGLGGAAIKIGADFEEGMSEVQAISRASASDMELLKEKAKEMGAETKFSATESAAAFKYMAQAGWNTEDMLNGISGVMSLAAASGEDLALTADIVTDSLTAFGLEAKDAAHFSDVLAMTANATNTDVANLGYTFKYVAPVAGALGYSIEDMSVAIGLMANSGIKAETAGTALRATLTNLAKPTQQMTGYMEELGISLTDAQGNVKPFNEVMIDLREGFEGLTEAQKAEYAAGIAGKEAMSGLLAIVNASDEDFAALTEQINNCNGAAEEAAKIMQDNLKGSVEQLGGALETLGIEFYDGVNTPIRTIVDSATSMVEQLTKAFKDGGLSGLVSELGIVFAEVATQAANSAPKMIDAATSMITSFLDGIGNNTNRIAEAAIKIGESLINGIAQIIPKVAEVGVEIISSLASNLLGSDVGKSIGELGKTIIDSFKTIASAVSGALNSLKPVLSTFISTVSKIAKTVIPPLTKVVEACIKAIKPLTPLLTAAASGFAALKIVQTATSWIKSFTTSETLLAAKTTITNALLWAKIAATEVLTGKITLAQAAQQLWNVAMRSNPIGAVVTAIGVFVGALAGLVAALSGGKSETEQLNESFEKVSQGFTRFSDGMSNAQSKLSSFNKELFASSEEQQALTNNMQEVQNGITQICKTATAERRDYTQAEIQQLEQYFETLRALNEQQLQIEEAMMNAVLVQAERQSTMLDVSAKEYEQAAHDWIATAQEQADKQIAIINDQCTQEIALLQQKHTVNGVLNEEAFNADMALAEQRRDTKIAQVNEEMGSLYSAYSEGYGELTNLNELFSTVATQQNESLESESERHAARIAEINNDTVLNTNQKNVEIKKENDKHSKNMERIWNDLTKTMSDEQLEQLAVWLGFVSQTELYGGQLDEKTKSTVEGLIASFDKLPQESRDTMKDALSPMLDEMNKKEPVLFAKATSIANGILGNLRKAFDIHSPSRKVRAIFNQVMEGAEKGLEDDTPKLLGQATSISNEFLDRLRNIDATALMDQARAAVYSNQMAVAGAAARSNYMINTGISQSTSSGGDRQTVINFNQPVESPDATARAINRIFTFGLAGDKG